MNNYILVYDKAPQEYKEKHIDKTQVLTSITIKDHDFQDGDVFFIPTDLSEMSPLSYQGVELALKLYFNIISKHYSTCKIILLGNENRGTFFELCSYAKFLHCPNVWYINNSQEAVEEFLKEQHESLINYDKAIYALKEIGIKLPASYKSHHSITNQWSVSRWSNCYGFETNVDQQIRDSLYFNYLKCIYALPEDCLQKPRPIFTKGKILVIDDELSKGWHTFFDLLFEQRGKTKVEYQELGQDFSKIKNREQIVKTCVEKILEFKPDVVLLDLRLHDDDFGDQCENFTSIKILEALKSSQDYNKGTQIIGFTASNKVWNYLKWSKAGIDDFILKESPENSKVSNFTQESLNNLEYKLRNAFEKAFFLKDIYERLNKLKYRIKNCIEQEEFHRLSIKNLDLAFSLLKGYKESSDNLDSSFLHLFYVIEDFTSTSRNNVIVREGSKYYVDEVVFLDMPKNKNDQKKDNCSLTYNRFKNTYEEKQGTFNSSHVTIDLKMSAIILLKIRNYRLLTIWNEIRDARNNLVHQNKPISKENFQHTVSFLSQII